MTEEQKKPAGQEPEVAEVDEKDMAQMAGGFAPQPEPPRPADNVERPDSIARRLRSTVNPAN